MLTLTCYALDQPCLCHAVVQYSDFSSRWSLNCNHLLFCSYFKIFWFRTLFFYLQWVYFE